MRRWFLLAPAVIAVALGCTRPAVPALQPGDVGRPDVTFAPTTPWSESVTVNIGVLVRVERPGGEPYYLDDKDVELEKAVTHATLTFLDGERPVGEPLEVPIAHDC